jgi:hypothetical protein
MWRLKEKVRKGETTLEKEIDNRKYELTRWESLDRQSKYTKKVIDFIKSEIYIIRLMEARKL